MQEKNCAYIDGQNLFLGIQSDGEKWSIDYKRFRVYLKDKYKVEKAYYFLGYSKEENLGLYKQLEEAGFIIIFKEQKTDSLSKKKGNIDSDLIFHIMKKIIIDPESFDKIVLVSGDGDFKILVDFLIEQNRFKKVIFPSKKYVSSLYKSINPNIPLFKEEKKYINYIYNSFSFLFYYKKLQKNRKNKLKIYFFSKNKYTKIT